MTTPPVRPLSVVITGVARPGQVGEAVALAFARAGNVVSIVARNASDADAMAGTLRKAGGTVRGFACDLADPESTARLAKEVAAAAGSVDALVNLAGGFAMSGPVAESDPGLLASQYAVNVSTAYATTRAFLPLLRERAGSVVFVASASALPGSRVKNVSAYAMAKSAVVALMRSVAQEEHANGVRANAIAPASIRTATNLAAMPDGTKYVEREEVADAIMFLVSPAAKSVNGQVVELAP